MCSHKLKKLSRRRPKPIRPGAQLISAEHLWKAFWKRWHDDSRRRSWSHNGVDSVIGNDVHCRARVYELRIVVVDSPLLLMIIITEGVEITFLLTGTAEIDARLSEVDLKSFIWKVPENNRIGRDSCELVEMRRDGCVGVVSCSLEGSPDIPQS